MSRFMKPVRRYPLLVVMLLSAGVMAPAQTAAISAPAAVSIPFEGDARHIIVQATVNGSRPLSFILDTGANVAIIRTAVAKELNLTLEGNVNVGGAGGGIQTGSFVRQATWSLAGLPDFKQPVTMALPFTELPPAMGRTVDGIIGGEFIKQFVVEVDYQSRRLTLHSRGDFRYTGPGEAIPIDFVNVIHPVLRARVTVGAEPIERQFILDLGAGGALALHSPFVREQKLLEDGRPTIRAIGAAGAGGRVTGRLGRIQSLQIGRYVLKEPITMFSQDSAGAFANGQLAGNIGAQVAMRFRLFLDYGRKQIIFEPSALFDTPFDRATSGLALRALGDDFRTFRVLDVLEDSPGASAGVQIDDVITSIDGTPAADLTMFRVNQLFETARTYVLGIQRGTKKLTLRVTTRKMI
jgi:hypothetical protein